MSFMRKNVIPYWKGRSMFLTWSRRLVFKDTLNDVRFFHRSCGYFLRTNDKWRCLTHYRTVAKVHHSKALSNEIDNINAMKRFLSFGDISLSYRYAAAMLRSLASLPNATSSINEFKSDIQRITHAYNYGSGVLKSFLESPIPRFSEKSQFIDSLAHFGLCPPMIRFLHLIHEHKRFNFMLKIFEAFENLCNVYSKEIACFVETAEELSSKEKFEIEQVLIKSRPDQKLHVHYNVSPGIVAGIVIRIGNEMFDYSAMSQLEHLKKYLSSPLQNIIEGFS